jgi:hypothetical protein
MHGGDLEAAFAPGDHGRMTPPQEARSEAKKILETFRIGSDATLDAPTRQRWTVPSICPPYQKGLSHAEWPQDNETTPTQADSIYFAIEIQYCSYRAPVVP